MRNNSPTKKSIFSSQFSNQSFTLFSPEKMEEFGGRIAKMGYKKILLYGELGAGKTHFVKGFVKELGGNVQEVQSPTYTYVNTYNIQKAKKEQKIGHFDFYRIEKKEDLINKGLHTLIDEYEFVLIERPKFTSLYADATWLTIHIEKGVNNERKIHMEKYY